MRQSFVILSMVSSMAVAQDTIPFFYPEGAEVVDPVATIKNVKPSVTEFSIACPTNVDSNDCGWGPGMNYTISAKTHYQVSMAYDSFAMSLACDHNTKASEMTCTVSMTGGNFDNVEPQTAVLKGSEIVFNTATIVQGRNLLSMGAASATPTGGLVTSAGLMTDASPKATGSAARALQGNATGSAAPAQQTGVATKSGLQVVVAIVIAGVAVLSVL
ncbi:hypothetical protein CC86DRAFT_299488 [Ophiobolus disseminans]|uniref:GPI anchored cell wall protein n=1 Tax=Ophiobolus disseminans TaxID=1469910 RepID=A0A6A6ZRV4_9PLEO|nr:hypothetical protein CC86DRAFT_299488 [Ophiobolus disseminans]